MQRRIKTYGKRSTRIITVPEQNRTVVKASTVTTVTTTANQHDSTSSESDHETSSRNGPKVHRQKRKQYSSNESSSEEERELEVNMTAATSRPGKRRPQNERTSNTSNHFSLNNENDVLSGVSIKTANKTAAAGMRKSQRPSAQTARTTAKPSQTKSNGSQGRGHSHPAQQRRTATPSQIGIDSASDSSEYSSYSSSKASKPVPNNSKKSTRVSLSSSDSPVPTEKRTKSRQPAGPTVGAVRGINRNRRIIFSSSSNSDTSINQSLQTPPLKAVKSRPNQQPQNRPIDLDSDSDLDSEKALLGISEPLVSRNQGTYVPTPQIKASHLRQARNRRAIPVPRISISSTLSFSSLILESPPPLPDDPTGPLILQTSGNHPTTPSRKTTNTIDQASSPLTWENTLTPPTARLNDLSLEDHEPEEQTLDPSSAALTGLLRDAGQDQPIPFAEFLETFKMKEIERLSPTAAAVDKKGKGRAVQRSSLKYRKIGDASYSEVFALGDIVLKIVPLAVELEDDDEEEEQKNADEDDVPFRSPPENVLKEIMITRAVGDISKGFIKLLKTYVVKGKYPRVLIDIWDEYKRDRGSESTRPNKLTEHQLYSVIALPHAGVDLESYNFSESPLFPTSVAGGKRTVWREAAEIFEQVTRALAGAEETLNFEHRDLHWGQIVIRRIPDPTGPNGSSVICATIIDLGLARILVDGTVRFLPFEEECFTGKGVLPNFDDVGDDEDLEPDYQFDVYRMMKHHNGDDWFGYRPLTNVMWLHYLAQKLLHHKKLRKPVRQEKSNASTTSGRKSGRVSNGTKESEWNAYQALVKVEARLGRRLQIIIDEMTGRNGKPNKAGPATTKNKRGDKNKAADVLEVDDMSILSAGDVLALWLTGDF